MTEMLRIKVPGKLMVAGEFAVLAPHQKLAVMAVNRFVYASLTKTSQNTVILKDFDLPAMAWSQSDGVVMIHSHDARVRFVEDAMTIVLRYLRECEIIPEPFTLTINSELDDASGIKYGLGSSAAVVTAVVTAILKANLAEDPEPSLTFKLAAISHVKTQGNGSGADVAASAHGGLLEYASFQAEWLLAAYGETDTLTSLLEREWTYFSLKPVQLPENIYICIGWTGQAASTARLVDKVLGLRQNDPVLFEQFLADSKTAVADFSRGMEQGDLPLLLEGVRKNRRALDAVGKASGADIETPLLSELCDLAEAHGGAGKPSGAGGGDCGIAFMPSKEKAEALMKAWEASGVKPLDIAICHIGAKVI